MRKLLGLWALLLILTPQLSTAHVDEIEQVLASMELDQKIGQMLLVGFRGLEAPINSQISRDIRESHVGSVILFDRDMASGSPIRNIKNTQQVEKLTKELQRHADIPLFISIDQEGGYVSRLKPRHGFIRTPSHKNLGKDSHLSTLESSQELAEALSRIGINLNFAPVVDVNVYKRNPIIARYRRSFSSDPEVVAAHGQAFVEGHRLFNVASVLKHFPGHGSTRHDSHVGFVDVSKTWSERELIPFQKLINQNKVDMIMSAHVFNRKLDRKVPSTLSKNVMQGLLRERLGYQGVIISDDMNMGAIKDHFKLEESIVMAIQAGVDILLFGNNLVFNKDIAQKAQTIIQRAIERGEISEERIDESVRRILELKRQRGLL